jgi:MFS family permease
MAFLTGGLNLVNTASGLIVIVLARAHHMPDALIGIIFTVASAGGIVGALLAPRIQRRFGFGAVITTTVWAPALLWPLLALVSNPLLLGVMLAGSFLTGPIYNAVQFSYRISIIPDELQGRVNSAFRLLAFGGQPLGAALSGFLIAIHGAVFAVLVFWAWYLLLAVLTTLNGHVRRARQSGSAGTA